MTQQTELNHQDGDVIDVPLNKLKKSPRNARRTPHAQADIEALAASIAVKGVLQAPVVEPEADGEGTPTGFYLVTIGEGRRLALCVLAKRKQIKKAEPVRCVVDLANDPHEISLDENVTRTGMHPADQFEAFRRLADERGLSAEEIAARFGVSAQVVRQRLRLGAVSAALMDLYRAGDLNLDQMMAFAVSEDHARQAQVLEQLGGHRPPYLIRRAMTEAKVSAADRRALFIGTEPYLEAGGTILRDLFTEDGGGWFEDPALLDRLVAEKLAGIAENVREAEGWKWSEPHIDFPRALGLARVYPRPVERSQDETAKIDALSEEYDTLVSEWDAVEDLPPDIEARFKEIDAALDVFGDGTAYHPEEIARGGVFVILGQDGVARVERGLVRPEDMPAPEPEPNVESGGGGVRPEGDADDASPEAEEPEDLDMSGYWTPTVASYLGRVTKAGIGEAVREAVSAEAAERIGGLKKPDMASEAEALLAGKGWLPSLLRAPVPAASEVQSEAPGLTEEAA
ncbi:MAG: chromosome partitioning protein ParB [Phenylobacterium sp.]|uniref:ParB/RepB/Spo0J family partition protein n=1 Tax=Phenylobacterium sp. TaxID=1871053 RepID=UPI0025ECD069|nr:ParB/RepB/Spo0J family partition protein [Phenylobacterium sp.]MBI1198963.1 chromosome partitioning protein ParB [Phenylobacterium sp.]